MQEGARVVTANRSGQSASAIGLSLLRVEDPDLLRGAARFTADVRIPRAASMMVVRSPVAHATLGAVGVESALEMPGVIGVFTAADLVSTLGRVPVIGPRVSFDECVVPYLQPILAHGVVRYVGEPVAIVVAEDRYVAEDAAEAVDLELDSLGVVLDAPWAVDSQRLFAEGNLITTLEAGFGNTEEAFTAADVVVEMEISVGRHTGVPMETRGIVVEPDRLTGRLRVHGSTKVPHWNLAAVAKLLDLDPDRLLFVENAVGGGFGVRGSSTPKTFWPCGPPVRCRGRSCGSRTVRNI